MTPLSQATVLGDVLRGHAQLHPAKVAVETLDGRSVTFAQLNSRVNSLVAGSQVTRRRMKRPQPFAR